MEVEFDVVYVPPGGPEFKGWGFVIRALHLSGQGYTSRDAAEEAAAEGVLEVSEKFIREALGSVTRTTDQPPDASAIRLKVILEPIP